MASKSIVIITKFDNPHQFWFRRVENEENRLLMEKNCSQIMANTLSNRNIEGKIGMKVLVKKKVIYKRALIQNIIAKNYECWLVDDGILYTTDKIYQMSLDISSKPCFAIQAGLNNISPTEMKFDFVSCEQRAQCTAHWTEGSILLCQNFVSESKDVVFIKETVLNNVEYGQLLICDKQGIPTSLTMELVEKQFAVVDPEKFRKSISSSEIEQFDNQTDALSMITSYFWDKAPLLHNKIEDIKPSGLSTCEINNWLSNNECVNINMSTTIDSDDSLKTPVSEKRPISTKSPEESKLYNPLRKLLQKNQMYKCSINVTDDSKEPENKTGTIPQHKFDNTDKPECDWSQFDCCIETGKGSSPIKTSVDYVNIVPAGYESGNNKFTTNRKSRRSADACQSDLRHLSKSNNTQNINDSCKAKNNSLSSDSSSINQPFTSKHQQRKSLDSYLNHKNNVALKSNKLIGSSSNEETSVNVKSTPVHAQDQLLCENMFMNEVFLDRNISSISADACQSDLRHLSKSNTNNTQEMNDSCKAKNNSLSSDSSSINQPVTSKHQQQKSLDSYLSQKYNVALKNDKLIGSSSIEETSVNVKSTLTHPQDQLLCDNLVMNEMCMHRNISSISADACQSDLRHLSKSNTINTQQMNDSCKAKNNSLSSDSSSINQHVTSRHQQRKSLDSYLNHKYKVALKSDKLIGSSSNEETSVNVKSTPVHAQDQLLCENLVMNEVCVDRNISSISADACQSDLRHLSNTSSTQKINDSCKAKNNSLSSDSSSINQPVTSKHQQRKSLDSFLNHNYNVALKSDKLIGGSSNVKTSVNVKSTLTHAQDQLLCENVVLNEVCLNRNVSCHNIDEKEVIKSEASSSSKSTSQDLLTYDSWDEEDVKSERTGENERRSFEIQTSPPNLKLHTINTTAPRPDTGVAVSPVGDTPPTGVKPTSNATTHSIKGRFTCHCAKCEPWNDCDDLGPAMGLRFLDDDVGGGRVVAAAATIAKQRATEVVRPEQLFADQSGGIEKKDVVIRTVVSSRATLQVEGRRMKRVKVPPVLVHCNILPTACPTVHSVPGFIPGVVDALRRHGYKDAKPLQVYGWPAATDGEHVLLVGGPTTGKTLGHVPVVASAILDGVVRQTGREKWSREREPTVIILCAGSTKADEVYDLYCKLVGKCDDNKRLNIALAIPPLDKQYMDQFKNKVDILVTTPMILCKLISTLVVNIKSLNILILEHLDVILSRFALEMAAIERLITAMLDKRTFGESVQLFMTSEHWTGSINKFLARLNAVPFICIAAPMETALYGNAKAQVHLIDSVAKPFHLKELIKDNYHLYKTVIVCTDINQISDLEHIFRLYSISFTTATVEMEGESITNVEIEWDSTIPGDHKILLCDDHSLMNYFAIRNAAVLVHFSLPVDSWKMFTQRFRCLFDSYSSPFVPNKNQAKCQIHIYIDDKCDRQLSRLISCFEQMGAVIPEAFAQKAKRVHEHHERLKLNHHIHPLCTHIKLTGQCHPTTPCPYRHMLDHRVDRSAQKYGHLPKSGPVRFRLLSVTDATTFHVRLMDERDWKQCCAQQKGRRKGDGDGEMDRLYGELIGEMRKALGADGGRVRAGKDAVKVGDVCILEEGDKSLRRCRVSKIIETDRLTQLASIVEAFMLDDGNTVRIVTDNLFQLPQNIKKIPYLAVEVRLANIIPPGRDDAFSLKIRSDIQHLLQKHTSNTPTATAGSAPHYYTGVVQLQLGNCLWLDDVRLVRYLRKTDVHLTSLILKNEMVGNFWGEWSDVPLKRLRDLCLKHKLSVPEISVVPTKPSTVIEQVTPQWAFLEVDSWNKVNFSSGVKPDCIYLNLDKFKKQLSDLHSQILHTIRRPFYPPVGKIIPGRYYLAPDTDQEDTDMCRVLVTNIYEEMNKDGVAIKMVECFFVDYGNTEMYKADQLMYLRDDMISQLPFQAIECSFCGFKYITSEDINEKFRKFIDEYILEWGTDFFRTWYIRVIKKHTVYTPCTYFKKNTNTEHTTDGNSPSRFIYSIHTYLDDTTEVFSLNIALAESVPELQLHEADDLIVNEHMDELIDLIVRERKRGDSDGEGDDLEERCQEASAQTHPQVDTEEVLSDVNCTSEQSTDETFENAHFDFDNFNSDDDIQISNKDNFVKQLKANSRPKDNKTSSPRVGDNNNKPRQLNCEKNDAATLSLGYTPIRALPVRCSDATLTPDVVWHQINSRIVIEVKIPAVEEYRVKLWLGNKLTFSTNTNDKRYALTLRLFKNVNSKFEHKALGLCVQIKLSKLEAEDWPRLVLNKIKQSYIKYNISKIEPEYDEDDEDIPRKDRRKFLDLGQEFADIPEIEEYWYNEDSDYDNSESDYAENAFAD